MLQRTLVLIALVSAAPAAIAQTDPAPPAPPPPSVEARLSSLEHRVERQEDIEQVRRLAYFYAYFIDNGLVDDAVSLLDPDAHDCMIAGQGTYRGRKGCETVIRKVIGADVFDPDGGIRFGRLAKHYLLKDIVVIDDNGVDATGRFDYFSVNGTFGDADSMTHDVGVYRFRFHKTDGTWRIRKIALTFDTTGWNFDGWAANPPIRCPDPALPKADAPATDYHPFPETQITPFWERNPVTGQPLRTYTNPHRYWQGNWPGDDPATCGKATGQ